MWFICAGVKAANQTPVLTKRPERNHLFVMASGRSWMNSGAVGLWRERDLTSICQLGIISKSELTASRSEVCFESWDVNDHSC